MPDELRKVEGAVTPERKEAKEGGRVGDFVGVPGRRVLACAYTPVAPEEYSIRCLIGEDVGHAYMNTISRLGGLVWECGQAKNANDGSEAGIFELSWLGVASHSATSVNVSVGASILMTTTPLPLPSPNFFNADSTSLPHFRPTPDPMWLTRALLPV
jgi:hypothetical protein